MKTIFLISILLLHFFCFSQEKEPITNGVITLINDDQITFSNLRYIGQKVYYINLETQAEENLFLESIKEIKENKVVTIATENKNIEEDDTLTNPEFEYPEGIYVDLKSFKAKVPTNKLGEFKLSQHEKSELHYGFLDEERKNFKKFFAVSYKGELYINTIQIHKNYKAGSYTGGGRQNHWFYKADTSGKHIEVYGVFQPNNSYLGAFGAIGSLVGSGLSALSAKTVPVIYNEKIDGFAVIHNYIQLKKYIRKYYPESKDVLEQVKEESKKQAKSEEELYQYIRTILQEL